MTNMSKDVLNHAKEISKWLKENAHPYVSIKISNDGVETNSIEEKIPSTELEKH